MQGADSITSGWLPEHDNALREWVAKGMSRRDAAAELNEKFGTKFTRSAVIGRCFRRKIKSADRPGDNMKTVKKKPSPIIKPKIVAGPIRIEQPPRMARDEAEIRCATIEPRHLTLLELQRDDCRYPYGDSPEPITHCGHPKCSVLNSEGNAVESSYCAAHHALCTKSLHANTGRERPDIAALKRRSSAHCAPVATRLAALSDREEFAS